MEQGPDGESEVSRQEDLQARVILSLDIFQTVRQNQAQHGLRHNDFKRYRHATAHKVAAEVHSAYGRSCASRVCIDNAGNIALASCNAHERP